MTIADLAAHRLKHRATLRLELARGFLDAGDLGGALTNAAVAGALVVQYAWRKWWTT